MIHRRTARRSYSCYKCNGTIEAGEKYHHHGARRRECLRCRPSEFEATPSLSIKLLTEWREKAIRVLLGRYPDDSMAMFISSIDACIQAKRPSDVASLAAAASDPGAQQAFRTGEAMVSDAAARSEPPVASNVDSLDRIKLT